MSVTDEILLSRAFEMLDGLRDNYRTRDGKFHKEWKYHDEEGFQLWRALGKRLGRNTKDGNDATKA